MMLNSVRGGPSLTNLSVSVSDYHGAESIHDSPSKNQIKSVINKFEAINKTMNKYRISEEDLNRKMSINLSNDRYGAKSIETQRLRKELKKKQNLSDLKNRALLGGKIKNWREEFDEKELGLVSNPDDMLRV